MKDFEIILVVIGSAFLFITALNNGSKQSRFVTFIVGILFVITGILTYNGWIQKSSPKSSPSPASTSPASTSPASPSPASTSPASTSPASTSPASTSPASTSPASVPSKK